MRHLSTTGIGVAVLLATFIGAADAYAQMHAAAGAGMAPTMMPNPTAGAMAATPMAASPGGTFGTLGANIGPIGTGAASATDSGVVVGAGPWFAGGSYGGGTAAGNFLFGASQVINAEGNYNLSTARGLVNWEDARNRYLDNVVKWAKVGTQLSENNSAYRLAEIRRKRHSPEVMAQVAASDAPRVLDKEINPTTGAVVWPEALKSEEYGPLKSQIEDGLEEQERNGRTPATTLRIHDEVVELGDLLRANIGRMPAGDFVAARKFLDSLQFAVVGPRQTPVPPRPGLARR